MGLVPYVHLAVPFAVAGADDILPLSPEDDHHLRRVLRLRDGDAVEVADGIGRAALGALVAGAVRLAEDPVAVPAPKPRLSVVQALPKGRKLDEVVRQVTELGVDAIVPVAAARSVTVLDGDRAARAVDRWRAVARSAAEQARRPWRPEVSAVASLAELTAVTGGATLLVAHPGADAALPDVLGVDTDHLAVVVGPEGGWTDAELDLLVSAGATPVGLGPSVLRTEHAAAAALAVVAAGTGRWS